MVDAVTSTSTKGSARPLTSLADLLGVPAPKPPAPKLVEGKDKTARDLLAEWYHSDYRRGDPVIVYEFWDGDFFAEQIRNHWYFRRDFWNEINPAVLAGTRTEGTTSFALGDHSTAEKLFIMANDMLNFTNLGGNGNLEASTLGSFDVRWRLVEGSLVNGSCMVKLEIKNFTTVKSALRDPVGGYKGAKSDGAILFQHSISQFGGKAGVRYQQDQWQVIHLLEEWRP